jgi:hypothetical protein
MNSAAGKLTPAEMIEQVRALDLDSTNGRQLQCFTCSREKIIRLLVNSITLEQIFYLF